MKNFAEFKEFANPENGGIERLVMMVLGLLIKLPFLFFSFLSLMSCLLWFPAALSNHRSHPEGNLLGLAVILCFGIWFIFCMVSAVIPFRGKLLAILGISFQTIIFVLVGFVNSYDSLFGSFLVKVAFGFSLAWWIDFLLFWLYIKSYNEKLA